MRKLKTPDAPDCIAYSNNPAWLTTEQAMAYFNLSRYTLMQAAEQSNAIIRIGKSVRFDFQKIQKAFSS